MSRQDTPPCAYLVPVELDPVALAASSGWRLVDRRSLRRRWFDTFDRRLWDHGLVLEVEGDEPEAVATLRSRHDHRAHWTSPVDSVPRLATDLAHGPWRRSLAGVMGVRALLEVAEEHADTATLAVTDSDGKTLATVLVDWDGTSRRARVVPLAGYPGAAKRLHRVLAGVPGVSATDRHRLEEIAGEWWGSSGDDHRGRTELVASMPARLAVAALLAEQYRVMLDNEPFLVSGAPDIEFLHDFRVAVRRSRSLLKLARGVVDEADRDEGRRLLRGLQAATGDARDLDVFAHDLNGLRAGLGAGEADDLSDLVELVEARRVLAYEGLVATLTGPSHDDLKVRYQEVLDRFGGPLAEVAVEGRPSAGSLAADRIRTAHRRLVKTGRRLEYRSPDPEVHAVRIRGKELRYAVESFAPLLEAGAAKVFTQSLKQLQNALGAYNDAGIQAATLAELAAGLAAERGPDDAERVARSVMAAGRLVEVLHRRQDELRRSFAGAIATFDSKATHRALDRMIAPAAEGAGPGMRPPS